MKINTILPLTLAIAVFNTAAAPTIPINERFERDALKARSSLQTSMMDMSDQDRVKAYVKHALLSIIKAYEIDALKPTRLSFNDQYDTKSEAYEELARGDFPPTICPQQAGTNNSLDPPRHFFTNALTTFAQYCRTDAHSTISEENLFSQASAFTDWPLLHDGHVVPLYTSNTELPLILLAATLPVEQRARLSEIREEEYKSQGGDYYNYRNWYSEVLGLAKEISRPTNLRLDAPSIIEIINEKNEVFVGLTVDPKYCGAKPEGANYIAVWGSATCFEKPQFQWQLLRDEYSILKQQIIELPWLHDITPTILLPSILPVALESRAERNFVKAARMLLAASESYDGVAVSKDQHDALLRYRIASSHYDPNGGCYLRWSPSDRRTIRYTNPLVPEADFTVDLINGQESKSTEPNAVQLNSNMYEAGYLLPPWYAFVKSLDQQRKIQNEQGQLQRLNTFAVADGKMVGNCLYTTHLMGVCPLDDEGKREVTEFLDPYVQRLDILDKPVCPPLDYSVPVEYIKRLAGIDTSEMQVWDMRNPLPDWCYVEVYENATERGLIHAAFVVPSEMCPPLHSSVPGYSPVRNTIGRTSNAIIQCPDQIQIAPVCMAGAYMISPTRDRDQSGYEIEWQRIPWNYHVEYVEINRSGDNGRLVKRVFDQMKLNPENDLSGADIVAPYSVPEGGARK